jgi:peroxiredoxin
LYLIVLVLLVLLLVLLLIVVVCSLWQELKSAGAEVIACVSVNDPFVMREWGIAQKTEGKVMMLADGDASFSKAIGMSVDKGAAMGVRSNRYAMVVDKDMKVEAVMLEKEGYGETSAESVLKFLKA